MNANIETRLVEHEYAARARYADNDWFASALFGSQNYELADERSDVDTKVIVFPSVSDICVNGCMAKASTIELDGEHCDVCDIRSYFKLLQKQSVNFVETLYTDYWGDNPTYVDLWLELMAMREQVAHLDEVATFKVAKGTCFNKLKAIKKNGDDSPISNKALASIIHLVRFCSLYSAGAKYEECIRIQDADTRNYLLRVKRGEEGLQGIYGIGRAYLSSLDEIESDFMSRPHSFNDEVKADMDSILTRAIARSIKNGGLLNE